MKKFALKTMVLALGLVIASQAALADHTALATAAGKEAKWLFVQSAPRMTFQGTTITLHNAAPQVLMFTDRPQRMAAHLTTEEFIANWNKGKDSFKKDPPNASLAAVVDGKIQNAVVELMNPKLENGTLSYEVKVLEGTLPKAGDNASLFVDSACFICF